MTKAKAYYELAKPGVTYGNAISAIAGYLFAAQGTIDWLLFGWLTIGTTLVIGAACALNNYFDQDIDAKMARTKKRAALIKTVGPQNALRFAIILGVLGFATLALFTSWLVVLIELVGYITYVFFYGKWGKRTSVHGTLIGSVSGAVPILAGYVATRGAIDGGALLVFAILFVWQMPEFYAISIYRRKEYAAAGVPVISVVRGIPRTITEILIYTSLFVIFSVLLGLTGYAGALYTITMSLVGLYWLWLGIRGITASDPDAWSRRMFKFSLVALLVFCGLIALDAWLP